jgi:hypothetical protein
MSGNLPNSVDDVTVEIVEKMSATGYAQLDSGVKEQRLEIARRKMKNQYSQRTSTLPNVEGNRVDALIYLAQHEFELAEGGQAESENSEGGSVTYRTPTENDPGSLGLTSSGYQFWDEYLFDEQGISVVRSR